MCALGEIVQPLVHRGGQLRGKGCEGGIALRGGGRARGAQPGIAHGGGVDLALALQANQGPFWEGLQVVAAGVFEMPDQRNARLRGLGCSHGMHGCLHRLCPAWLVVKVAHGQDVQARLHIFGQARTQECGTFRPGEGVFGCACLKSRAHHHHHLARLRQRCVQERQMARVHGLKAPNENGGIEHGM